MDGKTAIDINSISKCILEGRAHPNANQQFRWLYLPVLMADASDIQVAELAKKVCLSRETLAFINTGPATFLSRQNPTYLSSRYNDTTHNQQFGYCGKGVSRILVAFL